MTTTTAPWWKWKIWLSKASPRNADRAIGVVYRRDTTCLGPGYTINVFAWCWTLHVDSPNYDEIPF